MTFPYRSEAFWGEKRAQLAEQGYTVIESVVPASLRQASIDAICDFMAVDLKDRRTWYKDDPINDSGSVPMHHHPAFWQVRQHPDIYHAFAKLLEEEKLWVTMDRASFKPPCRYDLEQYGNDQNRMHWDYDFRKLDEPVYQGLIYLTDTEKSQGAFGGLPQVYRQIVNNTFHDPELFDKFTINGLYLEEVYKFTEEDITRIDAPAGSLVIFDSRLPHGNVCTHHFDPRFVQFIAMYKADSARHVPEVLHQSREERINCYESSRPPAWLRGWRGQFDPEPFKPAELSPLGKKLVGLEPW
ncbi:phytanoyl-CoA dioxygenase family protein [Photobacterium makurazakiensis]|uniref:phytanoyl-CoA dioxygenase family protein n=1 Tax=Photobacterium makurazakiensis TaxID=2910234 RepID=UPI003D0E9913